MVLYKRRSIAEDIIQKKKESQMARSGQEGSINVYIWSNLSAVVGPKE